MCLQRHASCTQLAYQSQERPLLLGPELDKSIQDYITSMRRVGGVFNTGIVMTAAKGIVRARKPELLLEHGGHIEITKAWAKSPVFRMGYVKRKGSYAVKVSVSRFEEIQEAFLVTFKLKSH